MLSQAKELEAEDPNLPGNVKYQMLYRELSELVGEEVNEQTEE